jgi:WhiB family redox-sensing transcriptional regulator
MSRATEAAREVVPCQREPELFFAESPRLLEQAKALCATCPVRDMCLAGALDRHEPYGVWGGQIFVDGAVVATKRGRGRPRKVA